MTNRHTNSPPKEMFRTIFNLVILVQTTQAEPFCDWFCPQIDEESTSYSDWVCHKICTDVRFKDSHIEFLVEANRQLESNLSHQQHQLVLTMEPMFVNDTICDCECPDIVLCDEECPDIILCKAPLELVVQECPDTSNVYFELTQCKVGSIMCDQDFLYLNDNLEECQQNVEIQNLKYKTLQLQLMKIRLTYESCILVLSMVIFCFNLRFWISILF